MDYQSNSDKSKEEKPKLEEKKIEKVISGEVVVRKKSIGRKFKEIFFGGEIKSVARSIASDVLLPGLRDLVYNVTARGVEKMVYGESMRDRRRYNQPRTQYYNNPTPLSGSRIYYGPDPRERVVLPDQPPRIPPRRGSNSNLIELIIPTRADAELVVEMLLDIIDKYGVASVADLYEFVGYPSHYTDNAWGWRYLKTVQVRQINEGYMIDLPQPDPI